MSEVMTFEQMQERYDSEWVLVGDPDLTDMNQVIRGTVLWHSEDRDEVYRKLLELRPRSCAMLCFADIPEGTVVVL